MELNFIVLLHRFEEKPVNAGINDIEFSSFQMADLTAIEEEE